MKQNKGFNVDLGYPIRWADSFATDNDSAICFTASQINYPVDQRNTYKFIKIKK